MMMSVVRVALPLCLIAGAAWAQAPEGWFEFPIGMPAADSVVDVSAMNAGPAGAAGPVAIEDGHFVDGNGERIRFLGTNLTFGDAFPEKERAPELARRMAALGMNVVRFHHMDNAHAPRGIWDPEYEDRLHMAEEMLDRLDWLIYQLKQNGIYCNINLHVSRTLGPAEGFPNTDQAPKYNKGIDNFVPGMIEAQKDYARDLLTHVNPYTGNAYVDEPCVAMVEITNEDSLLRFAMGSELQTLPEPYATTLHEAWLGWLREKYGTTEALREAWDEGSAPLGEEMLRNADFAEGTDEWTLEAPPPAEATLEVAEDPDRGRVLHAQMTQTGERSWHFQVHQTGHTLEDERLYTVSFAAKAAPPRTVSVNIRYDIADWRMVGLNQSVQLTEQWQQFELPFLADEPLPEHTRLSFNNGNEVGEVWYDDVSLRPGGMLGLDEEQSLEEGNVVLGTSAPTGQARTDWFEFIIELERRYTLEIYDYLKDELGLQAQVIDTQATYGGAGGILRESRLDYADVHSYWQHPHFPGRPWDGSNWYIANTPMTAALGQDTLTRLSQYRIADTPYTVSEYNHPAPNDYRAECMPMFAAMGALQGWDGLFQFCYGEHPEDWATDQVDGYFRMSGDPAKVAMFPIAANLFRRGDVRALDNGLTLAMPADGVPEIVRDHGNSMVGVWDEVGVRTDDALANRLSVEVTERGQLALHGEPAAVDPTAHVRWAADEDDGLFIVDAERTKVVLGAVAGQTIQAGAVQFEVGETSNGYAAVALTSMDGRPLGESERMLLVALNRVENQQMGWDEQRRTVGREWGHGPVICEGVPVTVSVTDRADLRAWALDGSGQRRAEVDGLTLGPAQHTVWYELAAD